VVMTADGPSPGSPVRDVTPGKRGDIGGAARPGEPKRPVARADVGGVEVPEPVHLCPADEAERHPPRLHEPHHLAHGN
jgi:hypothetical protein